MLLLGGMEPTASPPQSSTLSKNPEGFTLISGANTPAVYIPPPFFFLFYFFLFLFFCFSSSNKCLPFP